MPSRLAHRLAALGLTAVPVLGLALLVLSTEEKAPARSPAPAGLPSTQLSGRTLPAVTLAPRAASSAPGLPAAALTARAECARAAHGEDEARPASTELTPAAVEQLAASGTPAALRTLQAILVGTDRPLGVRLAAGLAVGKLASSEEDRAWLLDALAHAGRGDDAAPLADAAVLALGSEGASQVLALAADPGRDPGVRAAILGAFALSPMPAPGLQAALVGTLDDASPALRKTAVALLSGDAALGPLLGVLSGDADPDVRTEAALSLAGLGCASALPAMQRALELEPDPSVRKALRQSIARITRERIASEAIAEASSPAANAIGER